MKKLHNDVRDKGLEQISNSANWGGGVMSMVVVMGNPATAAEASTLYPAGKRISDVVAMVGGDFVLGDKAGGGRETSVAAKSPNAAVTIANADTGTATTGGAAVLNDTAKAWTLDEHLDWICAITAGIGAGQSEIIVSNAATQLTVANNWATPPDATSVYEIRPDIGVALYDGGGSPRVLSVANDSQDNEIASGTTMNIPAHAIGIGAA